MIKALTSSLCVAAITAAFIATPVEARKLPCGDYDGVPSHNDCAPVSEKKQAKCQKWLNQHNATNDAKIKDKTKKKYIKCVG